jgi:putative NADPH-quinone reductase
MNKRILIVHGHPDVETTHFNHALAAAYAGAARDHGHTVDEIHVAGLDFPLVRSQREWKNGEPVTDIKIAQQQFEAAEHLVFFYPLWLGTMPALFKGFLEQVLRPDYAMHMESESGPWSRLLKGRSARVVVTTGMPGFAYRWFYGAHSLKNLKRNILHFVGIEPVYTTVIGTVEGSDRHRQQALRRMARLGEQAH